MTEAGDFSFQCDDTWGEAPVWSVMWATDETSEVVLDWEGRGYWLTGPALRLLRSVNHLQTLFFVALLSFGHQWSSISRTLSAEHVPSFNFITAGLTASLQGGQAASFDPAWPPSPGDTFPAAYLSSSSPTLLFSSFFPVVVLSLSMPYFTPSPLSPQMQLSSIDNGLTDYIGELASAPLPCPTPPKSTPCLFHQGHPAARQHREGGLSPATTCFLSEVSCKENNSELVQHCAADWLVKPTLCCLHCVKILI